MRRVPTILRREERGAEILEFAYVAPIVLLLVAGLVYALLVVAAQVSLSHAASVGARYASLPTDMVRDRYPTPEQVAAKVDAATPFFTASSCSSPVIEGEERQNARIVLEIDCQFVNPLGSVAGALLGSSRIGDTLTITARAVSRRE